MTCFFLLKSAQGAYADKRIIPIYDSYQKYLYFFFTERDANFLKYCKILEDNNNANKGKGLLEKAFSIFYTKKSDEYIKSFNEVKKNLIEEISSKDFQLSFFNNEYGFLQRAIYNLNLDEYKRTKTEMEEFEKKNPKIAEDKNFKIFKEKINDVQKFIEEKEQLIKNNEFIRIFLNFLNNFKDINRNTEEKSIENKIEEAFKTKNNPDIKQISQIMPLFRLDKLHLNFLNKIQLSQDAKDFTNDLQGVLPFVNSICIDNLIFNAFGPIINNKNLNIDSIRQIQLLYNGFLIMSGFFFFTDIHVFVDEIFDILSQISGLNIEKIKEEDIKTLKTTFDLAKCFNSPKTNKSEAFMKFESLLDNKKFLSLFLQMNFNEPEKNNNPISLQIILNFKEVLLEIMNEIISEDNENEKEEDSLINKIYDLLKFYNKQEGDLNEFMLGLGCSLIEMIKELKKKFEKKALKYGKKFKDLNMYDSFKLKSDLVSLKSIFKVLGGETSPAKKASLIFSCLKKKFIEEILEMDFLNLEKGLEFFSENRKKLFLYIIQSFIPKFFKTDNNKLGSDLMENLKMIDNKEAVDIDELTKNNKKKIDLITNFFRKFDESGGAFLHQINEEKIKQHLRTLFLIKKICSENALEATSFFTANVDINKKLEEKLKEKLAKEGITDEPQELKAIKMIKRPHHYFQEFIFDQINNNNENIEENQLLFRYFLIDFQDKNQDIISKSKREWKEKIKKDKNEEKPENLKTEYEMRKLEVKLFYKTKKYIIKEKRPNINIEIKNNKTELNKIMDKTEIDDSIIQKIVKIKPNEGFKDDNENIYLSILAYFFSFFSKKMIPKTVNEINTIIEELKKKNKDDIIDINSLDSLDERSKQIFMNACVSMQQEKSELEKKILELGTTDYQNIAKRIQEEEKSLNARILFTENYIDFDKFSEEKLKKFIEEMRKSKDSKELKLDPKKNFKFFEIQFILDKINEKLENEEQKNNIDAFEHIEKILKKIQKVEMENNFNIIKNIENRIINKKNITENELFDPINSFPKEKEILQEIIRKMKKDQEDLQKESYKKENTVKNFLELFNKKIQGTSAKEIFDLLKRKQEERKEKGESLLRNFLPQDGLFKLFGINSLTTKEIENKFLIPKKDKNFFTKFMKFFWTLVNGVNSTQNEYKEKDKLIPADLETIEKFIFECLEIDKKIEVDNKEDNKGDNKRDNNQKSKIGEFLKTFTIVCVPLSFSCVVFTFFMKILQNPPKAKVAEIDKHNRHHDRDKISEKFKEEIKLSF